MPYRRLPKTDAARLKALKTLLDNNEIYTVRNRFIDWQVLNRAQPAYDRLLTACEQASVCLATQVRNAKKIERFQRNIVMYVSHFVQVLFMAIERGEIKRSCLRLYGLDEEATTVPALKSYEAIIEWASKVIAGEKARLKQGGRPIYNPTIGMVATHYDIFKEVYDAQKLLRERTARAQEAVQRQRPEVDAILLELWNQIEKHYENEPPEVRFNECRKLGVVYYYRRHENRVY